MAKINQKQEKRDKNEEFALKFKKKQTDKKRKGTFNNWCRTDGHPANCQCNYPKRSEIPVGGR